MSYSTSIAFISHNIELFFAIGAFILLLWFKKLPSIQGFSSFVSVLNSRGGNILVLGVAVFYFTGKAVQLFYYALELMKSKLMTPDNAILMMGLTWLTGTMAGGAMGALLKTMTGSDSVSRASDAGGNGNGGTHPPTPIPATNSSVEAKE